MAFPSNQVLKEGDIVSVDVGAYIGGFHGDCAGTYPCGKISRRGGKAHRVTEQLLRGDEIRPWWVPPVPTSPCGAEVRRVDGYLRRTGLCWSRRRYHLHESPEVPNYGKPGHGPRLLPGMTLAVEPMVNQGDWRVKAMTDGWTVQLPTASRPPTTRTPSSSRR